MAAASRRKITVTFSGDVEGEEILDADGNAASPASVQLVALPAPALDESEIWTETEVEVTVPAGATAVTILKDGANVSPIRFKGDGGGDTVGIKLHPTDPDSISLASTVTAFWLSNAAPEDSDDGDTTVRLFWS